MGFRYLRLELIIGNDMKRLINNIMLLIFLTGCTATDKDAKVESYIDNLLSRMTLREKIGQMTLPTGGDLVSGSVKNSELSESIRKGEVGGILNVKGVEKISELQRIAVEESRLGIPLIVGADVVHGYETIFPIPLAMSCSWDTTLIERAARISAIEASADGVSWTYSPMVDICRDARWGRTAEGAGEDPYLGSLIATAYVRGYQGDNMKEEDEIMSCVKHFALYGASESGRDYNVVDMSRNRMYNGYFSPYKAAVEAGAGSVMSSFNTVDGIPATANKWLLTDVLRNEWGFDGLIVTDYTACLARSSRRNLVSSSLVSSMARSKACPPTGKSGPRWDSIPSSGGGRPPAAWAQQSPKDRPSSRSSSTKSGLHIHRPPRLPARSAARISGRGRRAVQT